MGSAWRCTSFQLSCSFLNVVVTLRLNEEISCFPPTFDFHASISKIVRRSFALYVAIVLKLLTSPSLNREDAKSSASETLSHPLTVDPNGFASIESADCESSFFTGAGFPFEKI